MPSGDDPDTRSIQPTTSTSQLAGGTTSFFTNARDFSIGKQEITVIGQQTHVEQQVIHHHHPLLHNNAVTPTASEPILDASYLRDRKLSPPDSNCLSGTRQDLIKEINSWVLERPQTSEDRHIHWLYGYVGCGKSAIAQTVAEELARRERLAASFFFFRGAGDRSRTTRFAATIASQMSKVVPSMGSLVKAAIKKHPGVFTYPLEQQFRHLVLDPFQAASKRGLGMLRTALSSPYVIVIDGLDECEDRDAASAWILGLVEFFNQNPRVPLKFFISSRVEEHLASPLTSPQVKAVNLADISPDKDIAYVIQQTFDHASQTNRLIRTFGGRWPSLTNQTQLVKHTGGSFIFMATLLKFILEPGADHIDRLSKALKIDPGLDGLYAETLARSQHLPHFSEIISTIALAFNPLSIKAIAALLHIRNFEVVRVLINLHSILHVPGNDDDPVTVCHSSLIDFLRTQSRSKDLHVPPSFHGVFFKNSMRFLLNAASTLPSAEVRELSLFYSMYDHWLRAVPSTASFEKRITLFYSLFESGTVMTAEITNNFNTMLAFCFLTRDNLIAFEAAKQHLDPLYPRREDFLLSLLRPDLASVFDATPILFTILVKHIMYSQLFSTIPTTQLLQHTAPSRLLRYPSFNTLLVKQGGPHLLHMSGSTFLAPLAGGATTVRGVCLTPLRWGTADLAVFRYMATFWCQHFAKALEEDPGLDDGLVLSPMLEVELRHPAPEGYETCVQERENRAISNFTGEGHFGQSLQRARRALEARKTLNPAATTAAWKWVSWWMPRGKKPVYVLYLEPADPGPRRDKLSMMEVYKGFEQMSLCMTQECGHEAGAKDSEGRMICPPSFLAAEDRSYPVDFGPIV